jgi:hypothetical protein
VKGSLATDQQSIPVAKGHRAARFKFLLRRMSTLSQIELRLDFNLNLPAIKASVLHKLRGETLRTNL